MFEIDTSTEFGQRVAHRLEHEEVIWLTTTQPRGTPQPNPVWFLWENGTFLIYTQPGSHKLKNLTKNPKVSLHFNSDATGGDVIVFSGEAWIDRTTPPADQHPGYLNKYRQGIAHIEMTPASFAQSYSVPIRIRPLKLRGF